MTKITRSTSEKTAPKTGKTSIKKPTKATEKAVPAKAVSKTKAATAKTKKEPVAPKATASSSKLSR